MRVSSSTSPLASVALLVSVPQLVGDSFTVASGVTSVLPVSVPAPEYAHVLLLMVVPRLSHSAAHWLLIVTVSPLVALTVFSCFTARSR